MGAFLSWPHHGPSSSALSAARRSPPPSLASKVCLRCVWAEWPLELITWVRRHLPTRPFRWLASGRTSAVLALSLTFAMSTLLLAGRRIVVSRLQPIGAARAYAEGPLKAPSWDRTLTGPITFSNTPAAKATANHVRKPGCRSYRALMLTV